MIDAVDSYCIYCISNLIGVAEMLISIPLRKTGPSTMKTYEN